MSIVQLLSEEINDKGRKDVIECYETKLSENVEELSRNKEFFQLSLKNIFSVVSKIDLNSILEDEYNRFNFIKSIINGICEAHSKEKETLLILHSINSITKYLSYEEKFSILNSLPKCSIIKQFCNIYNEKLKDVDIDYDYLLHKKNKQIQKYREQIEKESIIFGELLEKPKDLETNIVEACLKGDLLSIRWLIEIENANKYSIAKKDYEEYDVHYGDRLLVIAI